MHGVCLIVQNPLVLVHLQPMLAGQLCLSTIGKCNSHYILPPQAQPSAVCMFQDLWVLGLVPILMNNDDCCNCRLRTLRARAIAGRG